MADTSIWPVVVGGLLTGLLTGLFTLGGIGVGLVATARRDAAQERLETRKRRADKFEELVAAVYEFDHWLGEIGRRVLYLKDGIPLTASPFAKVQSITSVYFPQFNELVRELNAVSSLYVVWIYREKEKRAANHFAGTAQEFNKAYQPYVQKREALLHALSARAQKGTIRRLRRSDYTAIRNHSTNQSAGPQTLGTE
jgi:hypothetical protein